MSLPHPAQDEMVHDSTGADEVASGGGHKYSPGPRDQYLDRLPENPAGRILDVGCANGGTGELALRAKKCGYYCGVEVCEESARAARGRISEVIVADIETLIPPWPAQFFDVLILSEVLEHVRDPWAVLRKLHRCLKPGARVFASSPNIAHYSIIRMLLAGRWDLEAFGTMDEAHLRWFTPDSYRQMFERCGYEVVEVRPLRPPGRKARIVSTLLCHKVEHLFWRQIDLEACCRAAG